MTRSGRLFHEGPFKVQELSRTATAKILRRLAEQVPTGTAFWLSMFADGLDAGAQMEVSSTGYVTFVMGGVEVSVSGVKIKTVDLPAPAKSRPRKRG